MSANLWLNPRCASLVKVEPPKAGWRGGTVAAWRETSNNHTLYVPSYKREKTIKPRRWQHYMQSSQARNDFLEIHCDLKCNAAGKIKVPRIFKINSRYHENSLTIKPSKRPAKHRHLENLDNSKYTKKTRLPKINSQKDRCAEKTPKHITNTTKLD